MIFFRGVFLILKITLGFIQPFKRVKLCKMEKFPLTDTLRFVCVISAKLFNPPCLTKNVIAPETSYFICYCMFFL